MKLKFEIGRKLLRSSADRDGFLRRGSTRACLNDDGKIPSERERLTRFVMIGPSSLKQSFKSRLGLDQWATGRFPVGRWPSKILYQLEIQSSVARWRKDLAIAAEFCKLLRCW